MVEAAGVEPTLALTAKRVYSGLPNATFGFIEETSLAGQEKYSKTKFPDTLAEGLSLFED